jgi:Tfp pilus assembly protein PilV
VKFTIYNLQFTNTEKGQSLFEVVMALALATIIVVGIVALAANSIRNADYSRDKTLATKYSEETIEWLRGERDADFAIFVNRAATQLWCLPSLSWTSASIGTCDSDEIISGTIFKREVSFSSVLVSGKTVINTSVRVYWQDSRALHEVNTVTSFTDWREKS